MPVTSSLIAIMLGRLHMSVQDCIDTYQELSERVFKPKRSSLNFPGKGKDLWTLAGAFDEKELERAIAEIVVKTGEGADAKLLEPTSPKCKV
jgi:hypothetical protein